MSIRSYEKYKPSGILWLGDVPEHWAVTLTKRFITVQSGDMISAAEESETGHPIIGGNGLRAYTIHLLSDVSALFADVFITLGLNSGHLNMHIELLKNKTSTSDFSFICCQP
jgi:hypothetical protein